MKSIWLVRHGESKSQTGESSDHINPELNERGKKQAAKLEYRLGDVNPDWIIISPLPRAWQTCELAQVHAWRTEFDSRLIELDWGKSHIHETILPVETPEFAKPDRHNAWLQTDDERTTALVGDLLATDKERILLFVHWGVFSLILLTFTGLITPHNTIRATMDNAGVSLLEVDGKRNRYIRYWNDRSHVIDLLD